MKVGAVIQARTSSTRLPSKVLKPLPYGSDTTVLEQVVRRVSRASSLDVVAVATSVGPEDDPIESLCGEMGVPCVRGSLEDVLSRYWEAATSLELGTIVRITSDCPCVDPDVIDEMVRMHLSKGSDFTTNVVPRTFPHGLDVEIASRSALQRVNGRATTVYDREHVFPYVYQTSPDEFRTTTFGAADALRRPEIRVTLDTPADYVLICGVYDLLGTDFTLEQLVRLFEEHPWLGMVNASERA